MKGKRESCPRELSSNREIELTGKWPEISEALRLKGLVLENYMGSCDRSEINVLEDGKTLCSFCASPLDVRPAKDQTFDSYRAKLYSKSSPNLNPHKISLQEDYLMKVTYPEGADLEPEVGRLVLYSDIEKKTYDPDGQKLDLFRYKLSLWGFGCSLAIVDTVSANLIGYSQNNLDKGLVCSYYVPQKP